MKIIVTILLSILLLTQFVTVNAASSEPLNLKQNNTLSVCSYAEFAPISYANGKGYEADLLRAIAKLWNVNIRFFSEKYFDGIWRLPSRPYTICDVSIGGLTPEASRIQEGATFSHKTGSFAQSLLVRRSDFDSKKITGYSSFKNSSLKIGVVPATTGEQYAYVRAKEIGLPLSTIVKMPSESELLSALKSGKIDAIARGEIGNEYQERLTNEYVTIARRNFGDQFTVAVNINNKQLLAKLNEAINIVTNYNQLTVRDWLTDHKVFEKQVQLYNIAHNKTGGTHYSA